MSKPTKTKTTFVLDAVLYDEFASAVRAIGLRRGLPVKQVVGC